MTIHRKLGRVAVVLMAVSLLVLSAATVAAASVEGEELRRIDTSNVNDAHEVKGVGVQEEEADYLEAEAAGYGEESGGVEEAAAGENGEEAIGEEGEGGGHAPAWMVPGWQSIFTVLAVVYFGLGVTLLPFIMAKEEH